MTEASVPILCSFISNEHEIDKILRRHSCYLCEQKLETDDKGVPVDLSASSWIFTIARCPFIIVLALAPLGVSYASAVRTQVYKQDDEVSHMSMIGEILPRVVMYSILGLLIVLGVNFLTARPNSKVLAREWIEDEREIAELRKKICWNITKAELQEREKKYADILSKALQIPTVSYDNFDMESDIVHTTTKTDPQQFVAMHKLLALSFPTVHKRFPPKVINQCSLLYHISGTDQSLEPIMLCAHLDVVPAPSDGNEKWKHGPFCGSIVDGAIWGRGAIDNKQNIVGQLGAIENVLNRGIQLKRGLFIALGHDEEIGGYEGAAFIATYLKEQNIRFDGIYDEGSMIITGAVPGLKGHLGLVGTAEKGMATIELKVNGPGGHSSMPPLKEENPISIIGNAVAKLEANPFPAHFGKDTPMRNMLETVAWRMTPVMRLVCGNFWLFGSLMKHILSNISNGAAASVRTTTAVTMIKGGAKFNVLPYSASAYVNHRIHPSDSVYTVLERDRKIMNDDRVHMRVLNFSIPASPQSRTSVDAYHRIQRCVQAVFGYPTAPIVLTGNTDTRHYHDLSENIYRFSPVELHVSELGMFHGLNEKISIEGMAKVVQYYEALIIISSC